MPDVQDVPAPFQLFDQCCRVGRLGKGGSRQGDCRHKRGKGGLAAEAGQVGQVDHPVSA
jgi:hypothetical protein